MRCARCFAPPIVHIDTSFFIFAVTMKEGASVRLKMRALRSIHTSQHTRMTKDFKPLRGTACVLARVDHHSCTEVVCFQFMRCSDGSASQVQISAKYAWWTCTRRRGAFKSQELCGKVHKPDYAANLSPAVCLQSRFYLEPLANWRICILEVPKPTKRFR